MLTCIDVKFIFDSVRLGLSSSANILQIADVAPSCLAVFTMFLAIISPSSSFSSYSWNEWNVRHFFSQPKQLDLVPRSSRNGALTCSGLHYWRHFLVKHILPNLVINNWLWWIMRVLLVNQNWGNILNE